MLILTIIALVFWIEMPGPARSVDWDLSQDRHIRQVGWPADNPLKDTYHIGISGFRHPRKISVKLRIADGLIYEAGDVANIFVHNNDLNAPTLISLLSVHERPVSLLDGKARFEQLCRALDMPPADLDAWQRKKMAGSRDDTGSVRRLPLGPTISLSICQAEYIGSPGRDTHVMINVQWPRDTEKRP